MSEGTIVVFDLEWNGGWGPVKLNEILEIGAVKLERFDGPVVDVFRAFVRPSVHRALNTAGKALGLSEADLAGGSPFPAVLSRFLDWCGGDCLFASWGPNDLRELRANAAFWGLDAPLPESACDLQAAAGEVAGARGCVSLGAMAEYFGLPDALDFHDALNDAFYAAMVGRTAAALGGEALIRSCRRSAVPGPQGGPDAARVLSPRVVRTGQRCGGFADAHALLSSAAVRRQSCPLCGRPLYLNCWFPLGADGYLTRAVCPEHGRQYFWATLSRSGKGAWRGKVHALRADPEVLALYGARDKAGVVLCKRARRRRRKARCVREAAAAG